VRRVVIGVGNPTRGDDAAGIEVAKRVRSTTAYQQSTGSYQMIDLWDGADEVIVVDAARSGAPPGTIHRIDPTSQSLPEGMLATSTHSVGVASTIEMARALGRLPDRVTVYGIEVSDLNRGVGLSPPVETAVDLVVEEIDHA
jgi:hydrogenase maturation protease